ncbi:MAG: phosphatidate cytidylyltransferase [Aestuariivirgaceae bacterium]
MAAPLAGDEVSPRWRDLRLRSLAAAVLAPAILLLAWLGGLWFELAAMALGLVTAVEWCRMVFRDDRGQVAIHIASAVLAAPVSLRLGPDWALAMICVFWAVSLGRVWTSGDQLSAWRILGVPYVSLPPLAFVILRADPAFGLTAILLIFAVVWSADSAAYFAGRAIGGPRLAPAVSPNKTWAGLAGAVVAGTLAGLVVAGLAGLPRLAAIGLLSGALAAVEQAGDLFESAAKRACDTKDAGSLIPGHGGLLDRADGLIAAACAAALLGAWRGGFDQAAAGLLIW